MKYKVGDRVYWSKGGMKMKILKKHWFFNRYSCVCDKNCVWKWFDANELKPLKTCK